MKLNQLIHALIALILLSFSSLALAGVDVDTDDKGVTLAGHDVVAYFTEDKAVPGNPEITANYNNAIYQFSSAQNRDTFVANPAKYAPAYGGFCAYGASLGKKFSVDGKAFKVVDGQLYVNKDLSVLDVWKKDIPGNIAKANAQWPNIKDTPADQL